MELRPLTLNDLNAVMELEASLPHSIIWEPSTEGDQLLIISKNNAFGIFDNNKLIGKIGFWDTKTEGWEVDGLIIDQIFRRKGYGKKLLRYALDAIVQKIRPSLLVLYTHPENSAAISLYLHEGFLIREWVADKYGPGKDRLRMIKTLQP